VPWLANILQSFEVLGSKVQFQEVQRTVQQQGSEIAELKFLTANFIPHWEVAHLEKLANNEAFTVNLDQVSPSFENELRHLRSLGFIDHRENVHGRVNITAFFKEGPQTKNVTEYFQATESGRKYLDYRKRSEISVPA
jgi:hypothetical protein